MTPGALTRELDLLLSVNPASPLFARLAEALIRNGEVSRAEQICEKGLELYPSYPTGRLIYAYCLAARSRYESALALLNEVLSRYPGNIALWQLQEEWLELSVLHPEQAPDDAALFTDLPVTARAVEEIPLPADSVAFDGPPGVMAPDAGLIGHAGDAVEEISTPDDTPAPALFMAEEPSPAAEIPLVPAAHDSDEMLSGGEVSPPTTVPSIQNGHAPLLHPVPSSWKPAGFIEADRIVSRTLAEIYASQGAIGEAVETYTCCWTGCRNDARCSRED